uniref:Uncharacterized protein n=1 Tax=Trichuris muris TaxID=70415 RepID=A0A5S6QQ28_TRIMR
MSFKFPELKPRWNGRFVHLPRTSRLPVGRQVRIRVGALRSFRQRDPCSSSVNLGPSIKPSDQFASPRRRTICGSAVGTLLPAANASAISISFACAVAVPFKICWRILFDVWPYTEKGPATPGDRRWAQSLPGRAGSATRSSVGLFQLPLCIFQLWIPIGRLPTAPGSLAPAKRIGSVDFGMKICQPYPSLRTAVRRNGGNALAPLRYPFGRRLGVRLRQASESDERPLELFETLHIFESQLAGDYKLASKRARAVQIRINLRHVDGKRGILSRRCAASRTGRLGPGLPTPPGSACQF